MSRKAITSILCFIFLSFPSFTFAWNALGHMVIAEIAYQRLRPEVRVKVDQLVNCLHDQYADTDSFLKMAYWPDSIRMQRIESFTHWHYVDIPFSTDGTSIKNTVDTDNAVWAMTTIKPIVQNIHANPFERTRFLAFLTHITGDLHQPLHAVTYLSALHPDGDRGGNAYFVRYNNEKINLHKLWDSGLGVFKGETSNSNARSLAVSITTQYPASYFGKHIEEQDANVWAKESLDNAKQYVYVTPENQPISNAYLKNAQALSERQAALAGYRLAETLNKVFAK